MGAEFNWWLLLVGVVGGGLLTWIVLADTQRREREIGEEELRAEAGWLARTLDNPAVDAMLAEEMLRAHRRYLGYPPPDVLVAPEDLSGADAQGIAAEPPAELIADVPSAPDAAGDETVAAPDAEGNPRA